jgi:4-amino-4-deoxy-L-arabinose transferase-like glycosyltransferase
MVSAPTRRIGSVLHWTAASLLFAAFAAMCLRAIGNFWQWGHNGWLGAAYWQAARNSLRFGVVGQATEHMDLAAPGADAFYTHHPMLLHGHLVLAQRALGEAEWAARLTPAFYSIATLPLLYAIVAALWDRRTALAAAFIYAVLPLNLIFANVVDHEQGSVFYLLCLLFCYVRWHERGSWGWFAGVAAAFSLAAQFDWPAYYVAAFMAAHTLGSGAPAGRRMAFLAAFPAVVIVNAAAFFGWIAWTRGDLADMAAAFRLRTGPVQGYWRGVWARSLDLYGVVPLTLVALWIVSWIRRRPRLRDLVPWSFLGAQAVHSIVFRGAGHLHAYWTWHANPAIAIAGAEVVMFAVRRLAVRRPRPITAIAIVLLVATGAWQTRFAWRQWHWGFATGSASYAYRENDDDYFPEIAWARELGRRFPRDQTVYGIHDSVQRRRLEFMFYLDAPHAAVRRLAYGAAEAPAAPRRVLIADLHHVPMNLAARERLADLAGRHAVWVWNRRFVAIDLATAGAALTASVAVEQPAGPVWRWFVNPDRPPIRWEPDPDPALAAGLFAVRPDAVATPHVGGAGGSPFEWICPAGQALAALQGRVDAARRLSALRPVCEGTGSPTLGPWLGAMPTMPAFDVRCAGNRPLSGIAGRSDRLVGAIAGVCGTSSGLAVTPLHGAAGGEAFQLDCPSGTAAIGLAGRSGARIDAHALRCAPL